MHFSQETTMKTTWKKFRLCFKQVRGYGGKVYLKFLLPPGKYVRRSLKVLDIVWKYSAPLRKLFAHPGVTSWLRAWLQDIFLTTRQCLMPVCRSWFSKNFVRCLPNALLTFLKNITMFCHKQQNWTNFIRISI